MNNALFYSMKIRIITILLHNSITYTPSFVNLKSTES